MAETIPVIPGSLDTPRVRRVTMDHPWQWLMAGWRDTVKTPLASLFYGAVFVVMGYLLTTMIAETFHMSLALGAGFMLVGPFVAMGLYDLSRRLDEGKPPELGKSMVAWRHNTMAVLLFGIAIGLILILWARLSALIFGITFAETGPEVDSNVSQIFFSGSGFNFLIIFTIVGSLLATLVFSISVVSIPMLLDRDIDVITAVLTSLVAVRANPGPMALWAALIVVFTGVGLVTFYLGLAVTMPLIGHASWHAYRDLVDPGRQ